MEQSLQLNDAIRGAIEGVALSYIPKKHYDAYKELVFLKKNGIRVRGERVYDAEGNEIAKILLKYGPKNRNLECPVVGAKVEFVNDITESKSKQTITLSESQLKNIIKESIKGMMKLREDESEELGEPMAYSDVARLLSENGWSIFHSSDVHDRDYRCGVRFNIEPERHKSAYLDDLERKLNELCDEFNAKNGLQPGMGQYSVTMSYGHYRFSPEKRFVSVIIWNLD